MKQQQKLLEHPLGQPKIVDGRYVLEMEYHDHKTSLAQHLVKKSGRKLSSTGSQTYINSQRTTQNPLAVGS
jgi:hypothetical protein